MSTLIIARQLFLFGHLIAFAIAISEVARGDIQLLRSGIDAGRLRVGTDIILWSLATLWLTGFALIFLEVSFDFEALLHRPKILAKLIVVAILSLNGILLHRLAFPLLTGETKRSHRAIVICSILGAISTASWLYAAFVGAARFIGGFLTLGTFLALYATVLIGAIAIALVFVRPLLERHWAPAPAPAPAETVVG